MLTFAAAAALLSAVTGCGGSKAASHRLLAGQQLSFKPGAISVGSQVSCVTHVYHLDARVPAYGHAAGYASDWGGHSAAIRLTRRRNGSVLAVCSGR